MIICDQQQFVFVHIPKCAGTSVRRALRSIDSSGAAFFDIVDHLELGRVHLAHLTLADLASYFPEALDKVRRYRSMTIVRDPFDRFQSAIFQRLREFKRVPQSAITAEMLDAEAATIVSILETEPARLELELVHFNRQSSYIELADERVVRDIFSINAMEAASRHIAGLTGIEIGREQRNPTTELRFAALRPMQRVLRDHYAQLVPSHSRKWIREKMTNVGLYQAVPKERVTLKSGATDRFIRTYYARDFEILAATQRLRPAQAA